VIVGGAVASFAVAAIVAQQANTAPAAAMAPRSVPGPAVRFGALPSGPVAQDLGPSIRALSAVRPEQTAPKPSILVSIPHAMPIIARAGGGPTVGWMPAGSKYYGVPLTAWVLEVSKDRRYGRVAVPYSGSNRTGWIALKGLARHSTPFEVTVDLSRRLVTVTRLGKVVYRTSGAIGAPASPTPPGRYFVTDRVPFSRGSSLGSFAFGISGIQTHLPAGWSGGNQLAIHGTNAPWTIGTRASAGCVRVSEAALAKLKPWLQLGTPVVIRP
jgi:lipoprotein-anchoring transpeptidase ErfK/SrfK